MPNLEAPQEHRRRRAYVAALAAVEPADTAFDHAVNWLAAHPRLTAVLVCAVALIPLFVDVPR